MTQNPDHKPVMLAEVLAALAPHGGGCFLDGTFGAGGYSRALLEAGAASVIGVDQDPDALRAAEKSIKLDYGARLVLIQGRFGALDDHARTGGAPARGLDGVTLDIGVSSMQLDQAGRGFSFMRDGPLDMRMRQSGVSAADIVNKASEKTLAAIFYRYGEEQRARAAARAIIAARKEGAIARTLALAEILTAALPARRPGQPHPATRCFQALRIAVNDELGELVRALCAAERALAPGGRLAVVSFHSLEDRIVKRFLQLRAGGGARASRHAPPTEQATPGFRLAQRKALGPNEDEIGYNPRARSAKLRAAIRLDAPSQSLTPRALGAPDPPEELAALMRANM